MTGNMNSEGMPVVEVDGFQYQQGGLIVDNHIKDDVHAANNGQDISRITSDDEIEGLQRQKNEKKAYNRWEKQMAQKRTRGEVVTSFIYKPKPRPLKKQEMQNGENQESWKRPKEKKSKKRKQRMHSYNESRM
jgi:hypothetical protein